MQQYAKEMGLTYIGGASRSILPFTNTSLSRVTSISNAVVGKTRGREVVFCDCKFGSGKHSFSQTVIAVQDTGLVFGAEHFDPSLVTGSSDGWTFLYRPRRLFSLDELKATISSL